MSFNIEWTNVKDAIGNIKDFSADGSLFSEQETYQLEGLYNMLLDIPDCNDVRGHVRTFEQTIDIADSFIKIIKPYADERRTLRRTPRYPQITNALEVTEQAVRNLRSLLSRRMVADLARWSSGR